jgi:glycosyltransferase involved in cell wall biosynthesis
MSIRNTRYRLRAALSRENVSKYWEYCQMYGIRSATRLALRRLRKPLGAPPSQITPLLPQPATGLQISKVEKTVSVIIPTKNAGPDLRVLLKKLRAQVGVRDIKVIVVDSGSSDATVLIARTEGATVIPVRAEDYTHAYARNKGAEAASGEYLLFLVQDAVPLTNLWLWEMVTALEANDLAAVSCAEYPRSDSDLFYQFSIYKQYDAWGLDQDRVLAWNDSCSSYLGLRSSAQLSDLAALVRTDVFAQYGFRKAYAEDIDLAIRLIRDGRRLGFLYHTRVLHSHNRPAYYFLKRGYVDARFLSDMAPNFVYPEIERKQRLLSDISSLYARVVRLEQMLPTLTFPQMLPELIEHLRAVVFESDRRQYADCEEKDVELSELISCLRQHRDPDHSMTLSPHNMLAPHVSRHFEEFGKWLCAIYDKADQTLAHNIASSLEKIFALHCGNHLSYLFLTCRNRGSLDAGLLEMDRELIAGV